MLVPFGGGLPFDLAAVLSDGETILRIQVKSGRVRRGCVLFNACNTDHGSGRQAYTGKADLIAVHVVGLPELYLVPVSDCPSFVGGLRLERPRNNQRTGVRFTEDYLFARWTEAVRLAAAEPVVAETRSRGQCLNRG